MYHQMSGRTPTGLMFCGLCTLKGPEGIAAQILLDFFKQQTSSGLYNFVSLHFKYGYHPAGL